MLLISKVSFFGTAAIMLVGGIGMGFFLRGTCSDKAEESTAENEKKEA
jgi:hypothetical protein